MGTGFYAAWERGNECAVRSARVDRTEDVFFINAHVEKPKSLPKGDLSNYIESIALKPVPKIDAFA